jgi:hypothetical protein
MALAFFHTSGHPTTSLTVQIRLDEPPEYYTNLDNIRGCVILQLSQFERISHITVKLEGESRTRFTAAQHREGQKPEEIHKVLYKTVIINTGNPNYSGSQSALVASGTHEYKFNFKIPFTNSCAKSLVTVPGWVRARQQQQPRHVEQTLPPSMNSVSNDGEISYFVKATIHRPGLMYEKQRCKVRFLFLPMEALRPAPNQPRSNRPGEVDTVSNIGCSNTALISGRACHHQLLSLARNHYP